MKISWKYLAGLVDGEGTIRIETSNYKYKYPRLTVTNSYKPVLDILQENFGGKVILHYSAESKVGNTGYMCKKDMWRWDTAGKNAVRILKRILPYLIIKKAKAIEVLGGPASAG